MSLGKSIKKVGRSLGRQVRRGIKNFNRINSKLDREFFLTRYSHKLSKKFVEKPLVRYIHRKLGNSFIAYSPNVYVPENAVNINSSRRLGSLIRSFN